LRAIHYKETAWISKQQIFTVASSGSKTKGKVGELRIGKGRLRAEKQSFCAPHPDFRDSQHNKCERLGYPIVGEFARPVGSHKLVYVRHQHLLIDSGVP
jgi:hypothetical protein